MITHKRRTAREAAEENYGRPGCVVCHGPMRWQSVLICATCEKELIEVGQYIDIRDSAYPMKVIKNRRQHGK
jgi:hypothetical protein